MAQTGCSIKQLVEKENKRTEQSLFIFDSNGNGLCSTDTYRLSEKEVDVIGSSLRWNRSIFSVEIYNSSCICFVTNEGILLASGSIATEEINVRRSAKKLTDAEIHSDSDAEAETEMKRDEPLRKDKHIQISACKESGYTIILMGDTGADESLIQRMRALKQRVANCQSSL